MADFDIDLQIFKNNVLQRITKIEEIVLDSNNPLQEAPKAKQNPSVTKQSPNGGVNLNENNALIKSLSNKIDDMVQGMYKAQLSKLSGLERDL